MCVLFVAKNMSKQYPLIIIANRDEFYQRPTLGLRRWQNSSIIAGQDLEAGGTWLGINDSGQVAALTNIRDPQNIRPNALSRGELVTNFLCSNDPDPVIKSQLIANALSYNGYNLLFGDQDVLQVFHSATQSFITVEPGIHGVSNAEFDTPWPKVTLGKELLADYLATTKTIEVKELAALLQNNIRASDECLPNTGIPLDIERALSSLFIHSPTNNYGTRCTSVLLFSHSREISFYEQSYDELGQLSGSQQITL